MPVLLVLLGAFAIALSRGTEMQPVPAVEPQPPPRTPPTPPAFRLQRDPFQFASPEAESPPPAASGPVATGVEASPPLAAIGVRLVGFVRQSGRLRAALVVEGEIVLLAVGEASSGYTVLAADETTGVRLRGPVGEELALEAPE
jgi:hypothetical protein